MFVGAVALRRFETKSLWLFLQSLRPGLREKAFHFFPPVWRLVMGFWSCRFLVCSNAEG